MNTKILEVKHLKKYYGKQRGVIDVSFSLEPGEIYGFIGPNGAGKSTTIRTIMGLINKTDGEILFHDKTLNPNNPEIKKEIGYLPSEIHLYEEMTVKELLDYHESFYQKDTKKRRKELVKQLKIEESKKIEDLSLGNLKKVGIVLALMHNAKLLILDEPTSGLDPIMQNTLNNILLKEGKIIKEDTIENIKKNNYTYITIESNQTEEIKKDLDLKVKEEKENKIKLINHMDTNLLIKKLSKYKIDKLLIEEISLEDLFVNYYK